VPIYYPDILEETKGPWTFSYDEKDVMLYALSIGFGADPMDPRELAFVYEQDLRVVPTAVTVLDLKPAFSEGATVPPGRRVSELTYEMLLHAEQKIELHKPLPPSGAFTGRISTVGAWDKGKDKGAVVQNQAVWTDAAGEKVATSTMSVFARGDGGFGGPSQGAPEPHPIPQRAPDRTVEVQTRPDQALLYRLNGDRNPLHCDPETARAAGFERPILHGLCTYGIACRVVLQAYADWDPARLLSHQARFSAPVFPGETLAVDLWQDGEAVSFQVRVPARGVTVIKNGKTVLR
jgi:acyl dehydratase